MSPAEAEGLLAAAAEQLGRQDPATVPVPPDGGVGLDAVVGGVVACLVDVDSGRLAQARQRATSAVAAARRLSGAGPWVGRAIAASAWALSASDHRSADALAQRAVAQSEEPWTVTLSAIVGARSELARGSPARALDRLARVADLPRFRVAAAVLEVRAHVAAGDPAGAREVFARWSAHPDRGSPWLRAEVLGTAPVLPLPPEEVAAVRREIVDLLQRVGTSASAAPALLHYAAAEFDRRDHALDRALSGYRLALERFAALGHPLAHGVRATLCLTQLLAGRVAEARAELREVEREAPVGAASVLGAAIAAADWDRVAWARFHEQARAWLESGSAVDADHALCMQFAGQAWAAQPEAEDRARAFRARTVALELWARLGRSDEAMDQNRALRALGRRGVAIPAGPFDLLEVLGKGGAGEVWRARHHVHGNDVAVKVLRQDLTRDELLRAGFATEIRAVAALEHPGIVRIVGHGLLDETAALAGDAHHARAPWYAMELVRGGTAQEVCARLRWSACRGILAGVLDALAHAHARGVLHLDIKPANVLLEKLADGTFRPRLGDFGLSGASASGNKVAGTPQYMAPEQYRGKDLGPWTDLYAVGCLAFALVTGRPPFRQASAEALRQAHLAAEPPDLEPVVEVPRGFESWVRRLLEKEASARFENAADASWALFRLPDPAGDDPPRDALSSPAHTAPVTFSLPAWADLDTDESERPAGEVLTLEQLPMPVSWRPPAVEPVTGAQAIALFGLKRPPLVGRHRERDVLWATLSDVKRNRKPRFVSIEGRSSSGRSSLARWLLETARERGIASTRELRLGDGRAGSVLLPLLQDLVPRDDRITELEREGLPLAVGTTLRRAFHGATSDAEDEARAVVLTLGILSRRRPTILWMEGNPAGNELTVELVRQILASDAAVLVVFEATPGDDPKSDRRYEELLDLPPTTALTLEPLRASELRELVRAVLPLDGILVDRVVERAQNDVDLAMALLRDLVERAALQEGPGGLVLRDGLDLAQGATLLRSWIDRLEAVLGEAPPELRDVLGAIAVTGRDFKVEEWRALAEARGMPAPSRHLRTLRSRRLLVPLPGRGVGFAHPSLPAYLLEEAGADGRLPLLSGLAVRWLQFDHPGHRGLALLEGNDLQAALEPLARGMALSRERGDLDLLRRLTDAHESALRLLGIAEGTRPWLPALLSRAALAQHGGARDRAFDLAARASALAKLGGSATEEYDAHLLEASLFQEAGDAARANALLKLALADARRLSDPRRIAKVRSTVALAMTSRGDLDGALRQYRRALGELEGLPWDELRAELTLGLGQALAARGEVDEAERLLREVLGGLAPEAEPRRVAEAMGALGRIAIVRGRTREASRWFQDALAVVPATDRDGLVDLLLDQCTVLLQEERWDQLAANVAKVLSDRATLPPETRLWALALQLAARAPEPGTDAQLDAVDALLKQSPLASVEVARVLEVAAERAVAPGPKRRCWTLAEAQWRTVGERDAARRARQQARRFGG